MRSAVMQHQASFLARGWVPRHRGQLQNIASGWNFAGLDRAEFGLVIGCGISSMLAPPAD
jgi:hypothetical protein